MILINIFSEESQKAGELQVKNQLLAGDNQRLAEDNQRLANEIEKMKSDLERLKHEKTVINMSLNFSAK